MALKLDYVVRETTTNLRRNVTLSLAAILTVAVSLSLFGCALLLRAGVENLSARWEGGIEMIVFLDRDITEEQRAALETSFDENPEIQSVRYVDLEESKKEAERLFARNEPMLERIRADENPVPDSYRIVPRTKDDSVIEALSRQYRGQPGVFQTTDQDDGFEEIIRLSTATRTGILVVGIGLLVAALMLILNSIRMAMFARRREIEVMKLVGATNWFIRVPFMLEGVVQGVVGAGIAVVAVKALDGWMERAAFRESIRLLQGFVATSAEVWVVIVVVVLLGAVIGAAGSGWAVSRFLRV